jgi:FKBP-type peptidyl-prolyl cis-trans isomerase 2
MGEQPESSEPRDTASMLLVLLVAGIVVAAGAVAYVAYSNSQRIESGTPYAIANGDMVSLNYIGRFADGRVFDTSILSVAANDSIYPKSMTFSMRSNESYEPFTMTAGNYGSGGTIKGFALGVIGLHVGDYKMIEVAPEDAYAVNPAMLTWVNLTEHIPVKEMYSVSSFKNYFNTEPIPLATYAHFFWKWQVMVASISGDNVTVLNQPAKGSSVYPFGDPRADDPNGWEVRVVDYDPTADGGNGRITVQNMVTQEDVYNVKGTDSESGTFVISAFNADNGTFQIHRSDSNIGYNGEIAGRALFFEVTIVSVSPETP